MLSLSKTSYTSQIQEQEQFKHYLDLLFKRNEIQANEIIDISKSNKIIFRFVKKKYIQCLKQFETDVPKVPFFEYFVSQTRGLF